MNLRKSFSEGRTVPGILFIILLLTSCLYFILADDIWKLKQTNIETLGDLSISSLSGSDQIYLTANLSLSYKASLLSLSLCDCDVTLITNQNDSDSLNPSIRLHSSRLLFSQDMSDEESCIHLLF